MPRSRQGSALGGLLGLLVFAGGVILLLATFQMAMTMFNTPPEKALGLVPGKGLDPNTTGANAIGILYRILLLVVMAIIGSLIANRGIQMFADTRPRKAKPQDPA